MGDNEDPFCFTVEERDEKAKAEEKEGDAMGNPHPCCEWCSLDRRSRGIAAKVFGMPKCCVTWWENDHKHKGQSEHWDDAIRELISQCSNTSDEWRPCASCCDKVTEAANEFTEDGVTDKANIRAAVATIIQRPWDLDTHIKSPYDSCFYNH